MGLAPAGGRQGACMENLLYHRWCGAGQTGWIPALLAAAMLFLVDADLGALSVIFASVLAGDERVGRDVFNGPDLCLSARRSRVRSDVRGRFRCGGCADSEPQERSDQERGNIRHTRSALRHNAVSPSEPSCRVCPTHHFVDRCAGRTLHYYLSVPVPVLGL